MLLASIVKNSYWIARVVGEELDIPPLAGLHLSACWCAAVGIRTHELIVNIHALHSVRQSRGTGWRCSTLEFHRTTDLVALHAPVGIRSSPRSNLPVSIRIHKLHRVLALLELGRLAQSRRY